MTATATATGTPATGTPAWHRPEYRSANCHFPICAPRIHSGEDAQHYFTFFSLHDAGIYQQVSGITPGARGARNPAGRATGWAAATLRDRDAVFL